VAFGNESCDNRLVLEISAAFLSSVPGDSSNMAVFTIELPSGFSYDADAPLAPEIQKLDEIYKGTSVVVYLNRITTDGIHFSLVLRRLNLVYNLATSNIELYDYYETSIR
jgi:hypothetical protein